MNDQPQSPANQPVRPTLNPQPKSQPPHIAVPAPSLPKPPFRPRRHTGNVGRLPLAIREKLNLMLRDGLPYAKIIEKLGPDAKDLNPNILCRWHRHGFQDWLQEQSWLEAMRTRLDFAASIVSEKNADLLNEAGLRIAITQMYSLLTSFDPSVLSRKMQAQPSVYPRLITALCKLADGALRYERHRTRL